MSIEVLAVRARGLGARVADAPTGSPRVVEDLVRERAARELAILRRWGGDVVATFELDEDRRTLRAIARGIIAAIGATQRARGAIPTSSLPQRTIDRLANAGAFAEVRAALDTHPLAEAFAASDLLDVEHGLARRFFEAAHGHDAACATYLAQLVDIENAQAALLLAARGGDLARDAYFLPGGSRLERTTFVAATADSVHERLARAFAGTPLAAAVFAASPAAVEDAALAWQLDTQTHLRRTEPLGLAPVLWLVLRRRDDTRRLRRAVWSTALGGIA